MFVDCLIVAAYIGLLIYMGLRGGETVQSAADFAAAGKTYGAPIIFMSLAASYVGGGFSAGNAAFAFEKGIGMTAALCGFGVMTVLTGKFLVPGIARFNGAVSTGDIIAKTYGENAGIATGFVAYLTCACVVGAQMEAMGGILHTLFNIPPAAGVLLGCGVVLVYSTVGGLQSVIAADIVQFVLLALGMPLLLWAAVSKAGGIGAVLDATPMAFWDPLDSMSLPAFLSLLFTVACGEMLVPPYTGRLLIGKNLKATARGTIAGGVFSVPFFLITCLIGLTARVLQVTATPDDAMPALILRVLPTGLRGLIMASMVSIMLSAADGFLNGAAVSLTHDMVLPFFPHMRDKAQLRLLRYTNFFTGVIAVVLALLIPSVFTILEISYTFWCPLLVPPLILALRGKTAPPAAFFGGMVAGFVAVCMWEFVLSRPCEIGGAPLGLLANFLTVYIIKHLRKA